VRNHLLVLPLHAAANSAAEQVAAEVPGATVIRHDWEWIPGDPETERFTRTLAGFATNPNVFAIVAVGLTADHGALAQLLEAPDRPVQFHALADHGGTRGTVDAAVGPARTLAARAAGVERRPAPDSALCVGLECGGSDALSGVTANPALGLASDAIVAAGGSTILAEISELLGAEHLLARRAVSPDVADDVLEVVRRFEREIARFGVDLRGSQPAPGNIEGGLTTIEEKSLGAAKKGGEGPISGVIGYAEQVPGPGLYIMDTPGQDIEQMVGMVAGGANLVAFTTGRGTPTGSAVAPCLKISTNSQIAERCPDLIDLDAGRILSGEATLESMGREIRERLVAVANGELTMSEHRRNREFAYARLEPLWS
jgi:altronate dehydratase large subunit